MAGFALAAAADTGGQAMLLAPTEVLARQHAEGLGGLLAQAGVTCALLTGSTPVAERASITERFAAGDVDVLIMNFANCDMVGHTGVFGAAVKAVRAVDEGVGKVVEKVLASGGTALIVADHGNAEQMSFDDGAPCTSHTTNLVPFIVAGEQYAGAALREGGALCDVAPTLLQVMGLPKPEEMEGKSLIKE